MIEIRSNKTVVASGDTVQEAIWELKRNRPGDLIYPDSGAVIAFVDIRPGDKGADGLGEMKAERLLVVNTDEPNPPTVPPIDEPINRQPGDSLQGAEA